MGSQKVSTCARTSENPRASSTTLARRSETIKVSRPGHTSKGILSDRGSENLPAVSKEAPLADKCQLDTDVQPIKAITRAAVNSRPALKSAMKAPKPSLEPPTEDSVPASESEVAETTTSAFEPLRGDGAEPVRKAIKKSVGFAATMTVRQFGSVASPATLPPPAPRRIVPLLESDSDGDSSEVHQGSSGDIMGSDF